jgi:Fe-S cluster assembly protein SufD
VETQVLEQADDAAPTPAIDYTLGEQAIISWLENMDTPASMAAAQSLRAQGLPNRRVEAFKYSDIRAALRDEYPWGAGEMPEVPAFLVGCPVLRAQDTWVAMEPADEEGLRVQVWPEPQPPYNEDPMSMLCAGLSPATASFRVSAVLTKPIVLLRGPGTSARINFHVAANCSATLIEIADGTAGLSTLHMEVRVEEGGSFTRIVLQKGGADAINLSHASTKLYQEAKYSQTALAFGSKLARADTRVTVEGEGGHVSINGAYLLDGASHADSTVLVEHTWLNGTTTEVFKGAVKDKAHGVFQGKIKVEQAAQKTDARLRHDALMLTEGASIDAKPELEIWADDVACAHGNTIGAIDDNALFYMRQRGIPEAAAKAMLVEAFIGEAFDNVADDDIREWLNAQAQGWLATAIAGKEAP